MYDRDTVIRRLKQHLQAKGNPPYLVIVYLEDLKLVIEWLEEANGHMTQPASGFPNNPLVTPVEQPGLPHLDGTDNSDKQ